MLTTKIVFDCLNNYPPRNFNTNIVESLNSLLKLETNGPMPINECVEKIKKLVEIQQRDVIWQ